MGSRPCQTNALEDEYLLLLSIGIMELSGISSSWRSFSQVAMNAQCDKLVECTCARMNIGARPLRMRNNQSG